MLDAGVAPDTEGHALRELHVPGVQRPHVQNLTTGIELYLIHLVSILKALVAIIIITQPKTRPIWSSIMTTSV